jgi:hypothetical protein
MSAHPCPRVFEAEAMRDGRLGGAERASFERHTKTCPACAREVQALDALARGLRESIPGQADELQVRRERTRLLAAFDQALVAPERSRSPRRILGSAIGVAVLGVGLFAIGRERSTGVPRRASSAVVHAEPATVWSEHTDGRRERVTLEHGSLWIHVDHGGGASRLLVALPDGELEDTGTTFAVSAEDGHTTRVDVEEGRVVLRLRGKPPVTLGPAETWIPAFPAPVACASAASLPEPVSSARLLIAAGPPPAKASAPATSGSSALAADGLSDFRAAVDALSRGDNREAAMRFGSFADQHPRDPRAEDAAYLRVIALQRCGDAGATKEAATEYLRRYPAGFRQAEVERLSR